MSENTDTGWTGGQESVGDIAPAMAHYTDKVLFDEVWERPELSKRDRSLVTVSALVAMGSTDQLSFHLAFAQDNGVTQEELIEALTHLAFYTGWPKAMAAIAVAKKVLPRTGRTDMTAWDSDVLRDIANSDDLHISPFRGDGSTYGTPTWIWSVVVDGRLFVRAWNGTSGRWYTAAVTQGAGRIAAGGHTLEVAFNKPDRALDGQIDAAYNTKYAGSSYLPRMVTAGPRAATVEILPRASTT
ncbi:DUF2255 family protein [Microbacterium sp. CR_7]|uniref:DUF2255 family protein n=1 Tax=Microbacterium sp. CR_7 TaxID=3055792 RepID=UPI0035C1690B